MPNQLNFEVEFTKSDIESIIKDPRVTHILVSGTYTKNEKDWDIIATAQGEDNTNRALIDPPVKANCIKPCPTS